MTVLQTLVRVAQNYDIACQDDAARAKIALMGDGPWLKEPDPNAPHRSMRAVMLDYMERAKDSRRAREWIEELAR